MIRHVFTQKVTSFRSGRILQLCRHSSNNFRPSPVFTLLLNRRKKKWKVEMKSLTSRAKCKCFCCCSQKESDPSCNWVFLQKKSFFFFFSFNSSIYYHALGFCTLVYLWLHVCMFLGAQQTITLFSGALIHHRRTIWIWIWKWNLTTEFNSCVEDFSPPPLVFLARMHLPVWKITFVSL